MPKKLDRIKSIGFSLAGRCRLVDQMLVFDLNELAAARNVLYAFVIDDEVMYIGKTVQPLRARMSGYRTPGPTQSTNIRNNRNLCECLACEQRVELFVLPDNGLLHYGGFHVNLAAGLEDSLVRDLAPPWNGGRKESANGSLKRPAVPPTQE